MRRRTGPDEGSLYEPTAAFAIRAPLLPVERYAQLSGPPDGDRSAAQDTLVRNAIHAASPALGHALDTASGAEMPPAAASATLRYLIRMSTRPTPFGLFAGVGLGQWGERTSLRIAELPRPTRTRPDMGWLLDWMLALEADPDVRNQARLLANPAAFERDGRVHLSDRGTGGRSGLPDVSVRATGVVRQALALARDPVDRAGLCARLLAVTGASEERIHTLVEELCRVDLLLSDLRPPLTADPVRYAVQRLRSRPATRDAGETLARAAAQLAALDKAPLERNGYPAALRAARAHLRELHAGPDTDADVLQVDCALPLAGRTLNDSVATDAARAVDLLLRLHPAPGGPPHLAAYRRDFLIRYGHERRVPLLEVLDHRFGLGPPELRRTGWPDQGARQPPGRDSLLMELAAGALRDGADEVVLGESELDALSSWTPRPAQLPPSLELSLFLVAADPSSIDRGEYRLLVGPNLGGQAAGRGLGRFADLLGADARELLERVARAEDQLHGDGVSAELVYLPVRHRAANVTIRPPVRRYEIPVGVAAGVPRHRVVAPDRLALLVRDGRLRLWWEDGRCEITVAAGHMLNTTGAPQVCRFLHEVGQDGVTGLCGFAWGQATSLPFLPRVRVGRIVLRPAEWRAPRDRLRDVLRTDDRAAFEVALKDWRNRWRVPRQVYLVAADNRLLLDLEDPEQGELLRADVRRAGGDLVLQEGLPGTADTWLPGPGGRYVNELVVPMVRRSEVPGGPAALQSTDFSPAGEADRMRPPGSDWLFLKLYGPAAGEDRVLSGPVRDLARTLLDDGDADSWFFVRYSDPDPHLRLRLHGEPDRLMARALPRLTVWAAGLIANGLRTKFTVETYEREVERYGGEAGMPLAETIFAADSAAVASLLALLRPDGGPERLDVAVLTTQALLSGLGMDPAASLAWCAVHAPPPRESGAAYRQRKDRLRALLGGGPGAVSAWSLEAATILRRLTDEVAPAGARLAALHSDGEVSLPVDEIARSLVHLNANRLGLDHHLEGLAIGLLRRSLVSLMAAPLPRA